MREIKFRAWDAKEKRMLEVNHLFNLDNKQPIEVWTNYYEGGYRFNPDKSELMQYTGMHDKNDKPIYENDVLKSVGGNTEVVIYIDGRFEPVCWYDEKTYEVIGNIHENADLLEEE